jgi:hypothetical protein
MQKIQVLNLLQNSAQIVRQYNLGDEKYFFNKFPNSNKTQLTTAWTFAIRKIQNKEIIKDASNLSADEAQKAKEKAIHFDKSIQSIFFYLNSDFDVKKLKLADENIERRVRKILAEEYLDLTSKEITDLPIKDKSSIKSKTITFLSKFKAAFIILGIIGAFSTPRIIDGLTPVETLTTKIHDRSKYEYRIGATCSDGWHSNATGRGACSHHGGVAKWIYETAYHKTIEECRQEAEKISWRD